MNKAGAVDSMSMSVQRTRYVREDGKVAVIIHPDYGGGWSTWMGPEHSSTALFDPNVVEMILAFHRAQPNIQKAFEMYCKGTYGEEYSCRLDELAIVWLDFGTEFYVVEYDGREYIRLKSEFQWNVA